MTEQSEEDGPETSAAISSLGGRTIELDPEAGWLEVEFSPDPAGEDETASLRTLFEALLEEVAEASGGSPGRTAYVKANLASERPAEALIGRARVMMAGPTIAYAQGELRTVGGKLVGTGASMVRFARQSAAE